MRWFWESLSCHRGWHGVDPPYRRNGRVHRRRQPDRRRVRRPPTDVAADDHGHDDHDYTAVKQRSCADREDCQPDGRQPLHTSCGGTTPTLAACGPAPWDQWRAVTLLATACEPYQFGSGVDAELREHAAKVGVDRVRGDAQLAGGFTVRRPVGDQFEDA